MPPFNLQSVTTYLALIGRWTRRKCLEWVHTVGRRRETLSRRTATTLASVSLWAAHRRAEWVLRAENAQMKCGAWIAARRPWLGGLVLVALIGVSAILAPDIRRLLLPLVAEIGAGQADQLAVFRTLVGTIGGALVGATAIAFSVVMIAVQINFARMPYGLFRRLSSDVPLLAYFAVTFLLALVVAATSFVPAEGFVWGLLVALWGCVFTLLLFLLAYRRALALINPVFQLSLLVKHSTRDLRWWSRRADRSIPLIMANDQSGQNTRESARVVFFGVHRNWHSAAKLAVTHAMSFARSYSALGDHEVSRVAFAAIAQISGAYVSAKGQTFFQSSALISNPFVTDGFINDVLEGMRKHVREVLSRKDEEGIEQTCDGLAQLVEVFCKIDYGNKYRRTKEHANLAAGYLTQAIEGAIPHDMPDVLMHGARLAGRTGLLLAANGEANDVLVVTDILSKLAITGVANRKFEPVTQCGVGELVRLLKGLLASKLHDVDYASRQVTYALDLVANFVLATMEDRRPLSSHSSSLSAYYGFDDGAFATWIIGVANALLEVSPGDEPARLITGHIADWAEKVPREQKKVFELAIKNQSFLTSDLVRWIGQVAQALTALAQSPGCQDHVANELREYASNLVLVLTAVPDDKETVGRIAGFNFDETLFEIAWDAASREAKEVLNAARDGLLFWAFRRGHHRAGWAVFEDAIKALAVLAVKLDDEHELKTQIAAGLAAAPLIEAEHRLSVARSLRELSRRYWYDQGSTSVVSYRMQGLDRSKMTKLLEELSELLKASVGTR